MHTPPFHPKNITLIGCGSFGIKIYNELSKLEKQNLIRISKILTKSGSPVSDVPEELIDREDEYTTYDATQVDAVIIATPKETHAKLIKKYLPYTNVLAEKPIATTECETRNLEQLIQKESNHLFAPGHIFRFHPVTEKAKTLIKTYNSTPIQIKGEFLNPENNRESFESPELEMIHLLDICDYFYGSTPIHTWKEPFRNSAHLFVAYQNGATGEFTLGWHTENTKKRWLEIFYDSASLHLDFINNEVALKKNSDKFEKFCLKKEQTSIRDQILNFINAIDQRESLRTTFNNAKTVLKATGIDKKINKTKKHKPRVAVIGGGVFGATSAIELAKFCDVDLIEKNKSLMNESSYLNQWRHHSGFHYPLSFETAQEIKETKKEFESIFQEAIKYSYTSYYLVSSYAREIPAERYLSACNLYNLNYRITPPPRHLKDGSTSVCLETDEGIYDIPKMQEIIEKNIQKNCNIRKLLSTEVTSGKIKKDSTKTIYLQNSHSCWKNDYDFVINCTYANLGLIIDYLSLPQIDLRIEEVELLEIEADIDDICLTIIDGPFISLTSMGHENKFLLSHRDHSVRRRLKTHDLTSPVSGYVTKTDSYSNILSAAKEYIPALAEAKYIQSWISYKAIQNQTNNFWNRPTLIHNHGFGVWSLLGGKILTSVTNAKEVAEHIKRSKLNV